MRQFEENTFPNPLKFKRRRRRRRLCRVVCPLESRVVRVDDESHSFYFVSYGTKQRDNIDSINNHQ